MEPALAAQEKTDFGAGLQCQGDKSAGERPASGRGPCKRLVSGWSVTETMVKELLGQFKDDGLGGMADLLNFRLDSVERQPECRWLRTGLKRSPLLG